MPSVLNVRLTPAHIVGEGGYCQRVRVFGRNRVKLLRSKADSHGYLYHLEEDPERATLVLWSLNRITKWAPPSQKLTRLSASVWYPSGSAPVPETAVGGFLQTERGIQSAKGSDLDPKIDVPDSMFVVTTSCAVCGEQFYVTTLESDWTAEYRCPDCCKSLSSTKGYTRIR